MDNKLFMCTKEQEVKVQLMHEQHRKFFKQLYKLIKPINKQDDEKQEVIKQVGESF